MISELFFYILRSKVKRYFAKRTLTHTVTHIIIVYSGQSIIKQHLLAAEPEKSE